MPATQNDVRAKHDPLVHLSQHLQEGLSAERLTARTSATILPSSCDIYRPASFEHSGGLHDGKGVKNDRRLLFSEQRSLGADATIPSRMSACVRSARRRAGLPWVLKPERTYVRAKPTLRRVEVRPLPLVCPTLELFMRGDPHMPGRPRKKFGEAVLGF